MNRVIVSHYQSPAGELIVGSRGDSLVLCDWMGGYTPGSGRHHPVFNSGRQVVKGTSSVIKEAIVQLNEYFEGGRREFSIPVALFGSDFQRRVWNELMNIPYGSTVSYLEIARRVGNPKAVRAVASAIAANIVSIFVPCHRVIGSDNRLTGYRGGLKAKSMLLNIESRDTMLPFNYDTEI